MGHASPGSSGSRAEHRTHDTRGTNLTSQSRGSMTDSLPQLPMSGRKLVETAPNLVAIGQMLATFWPNFGPPDSVDWVDCGPNPPMLGWCRSKLEGIAPSRTDGTSRRRSP